MPELKNYRHELFCREYIKNGGNASAAVKAAGYKCNYPSYARSQGTRVKAKDSVQQRLAELKSQVIDIADLSISTIAKGMLNEAMNARSESTRLAAWKALSDLIHGSNQRINVTSDSKGDEYLITKLAELGVSPDVARRQLGYKDSRGAPEVGDRSIDCCETHRLDS